MNVIGSFFALRYSCSIMKNQTYLERVDISGRRSHISM